MNARYFLVLGLFFIGFIISWMLGGVFFAVIFLLLWVDRVLLSTFSLKKSLTIEFSSLPIIMMGAYKGPVFGFIFAFLALILTDYVMKILFSKEQIVVSSLFTTEAINLMILAIIGGVLGNMFGILMGSIITFAVKELVALVIKGKLLGSTEAYFTHGLNFGFNTVLFIALMKIIELL